MPRATVPAVSDREPLPSPALTVRAARSSPLSHPVRARLAVPRMGLLPLLASLMLAGWAEAQPRKPGRTPASTPGAATGGSGLCPAPATWGAGAELGALLPPEAAAGPRDRLEGRVPVGRDADLPVQVEADRLSGTPGVESVAEGSAVLSRGPITLRADRIGYKPPDDLAQADGGVIITREGNVFRGKSLSLKLGRYEGEFVEPSYFFARTQAGGTAARFEFLGENRGRATDATYSSCPPADPDWVMRSDRVTLDFDANEGVAEGAVLRFMGVPILAAPRLSFPLTDARKSGWLPPNVNLDSKSGLDVAVPYYWNIAPDRDLTVTPRAYSRRGAGATAEYRYLTPSDRGTLEATALPNDQVAGRDRWMVYLRHDGGLDPRPPVFRKDESALLDYRFTMQRVSDDAYWKDFPRSLLPTLTPRLLPTSFQAEHRQAADWGLTTVYARVQRYQVLQDIDLNARIVAPYRREPQVGLRQVGAAQGFEWRWETEANRFTHEDRNLIAGDRVHLLGSLARPFRPLGASGWTVTPRLTLNSASYRLDDPLANGRSSASRTLPTASLDSAWVFERDASYFGRAFLQTLEPRLLYVRTPYRRQDQLPNFDSAANDFNITSIFAESSFSGIDRVSDANQLTAGVTSRFLDPTTGAEAMRLGVVQRVLFSDQRVTPDGNPITQRLSDVLLLGSTSLVPRWWLDGNLQYSTQNDRVQRQVIGVRYSPGPLRTLNAAYRFTRDATEQLEVGWQWPLNAPGREHAQILLDRERQAAERGEPIGLSRFGSGRAGAGCAGAWYTVGNLKYSRRDDRLTDAIVGFEYDSGCWIARIVAERLSTGRTEATTRLLLQLELVGLSRLGSNPLYVLRNNIPGYRPLRDEGASIGSLPLTQ